MMQAIEPQAGRLQAPDLILSYDHLLNKKYGKRVELPWHIAAYFENVQ